MNMKLRDAISIVTGPPEEVTEEALSVVGMALESPEAKGSVFEIAKTLHPLVVVGLKRFCNFDELMNLKV